MSLLMATSTFRLGEREDARVLHNDVTYIIFDDDDDDDDEGICRARHK